MFALRAQRHWENSAISNLEKQNLIRCTLLSFKALLGDAGLRAVLAIMPRLAQLCRIANFRGVANRPRSWIEYQAVGCTGFLELQIKL